MCLPSRPGGTPQLFAPEAKSVPADNPPAGSVALAEPQPPVLTDPLPSEVGAQALSYDALWDRAPTFALLREAARLATRWPLEAQSRWSERLRSAGLWSDCPLIANAQDGALPLEQRAAAAATAWDLDRDRRARAVIRCLVPGLDPAQKARVAGLLSPAALADLDRLPDVWSLTSFFNELDMLEARLSEMARSVDHFVIVEAARTFRGDPKPLHFQEHHQRYAKWSAQLDHCVVDLPDDDSALALEPDREPWPWELAAPATWARERYQRNIGYNILRDLGAQGNDLVLLTDLDEIVRSDRVDAVLEATTTSPVILLMAHYWYNVRWQDPRPWGHAKAFRYGQVPQGRTLHDIRHSPYPVLHSTGWHFSYFGKGADLDMKLSASSHVEQDTPERHSAEYQRQIVQQGLDLSGRPLLPSCEYFPASLVPLLQASPA